MENQLELGKPRRGPPESDEIRRGRRERNAAGRADVVSANENPGVGKRRELSPAKDPR